MPWSRSPPIARGAGRRHRIMGLKIPLGRPMLGDPDEWVAALDASEES
jgi:hypothetical protein